ncbi:MAG: hypothetical protein COV74_01650 [Candidatus Omnitrophica bacterium CG11_big_fil_rev_8_21_14_0_20_45_26]|uniref:Major facilitator superfamily (MFS) profile domain-containing protein n=1 Tax=Candidatus Abzuiibacterium crystallinum TaxID=1974748 RepID=A0A2H0LSB8_9BACT|nr:MAG: hypothetical protein COV74_01650 [Candidatus Omnitrophica bacterium CG11_big_fil_rev_8_21_14_0_20_45_26]PIW65000.1 MAG: hypothetical protein COW12_03930 [Candidatus Omnitrophica bacterium CG12_big_fil_rev_8_21_14_0_65_45_16]
MSIDLGNTRENFKSLQPDIVHLTSVVYFFQGCLGIVGIALPLFLRNMGFSVSKIAYFTSIMTVPWLFKIIYGSISDAYPIRGKRRKPYLLFYAVAASLGWLLLSCVPAKWWWLLLAALIAQLGFAGTDVVTDGIVVEHSDEKTTQIYQSIAWGARSVGALLTGVMGGYLAAHLPYRVIFAVMGCLPLIILIAVLNYQENVCKDLARRDGFLSSLVKSFKLLFTIRDLGLFCIILFISTLSGMFVVPLFFYLKETLGFSELFLGSLSSITWGGAIVGCFLYLKFLNHLPLKKALYLAFGIGVVSIISCLAIRSQLSSIMIYFMGGVLGYIGILPLMSTAAKLSHKTGVEGSLFAILMSVHNIGVSSSGILGGWLFKWVSIEQLILMSAAMTCAGFFVIARLKTVQ